MPLLINTEIEVSIRELKARIVGDIQVGGPELAGGLTNLGLVDEYQLYFHPVALGHGKPFFTGPTSPLRLVANEMIGEGAIRLTYVPIGSAARSVNTSESSRPRRLDSA